MSKLTSLTLAAARAGLRQRAFSASELVDAHLTAIAEANDALNAYVLVTKPLLGQRLLTLTRVLLPVRIALCSGSRSASRTCLQLKA